VAQAQAAVAQAQSQQAQAEANQTALEQKVTGACAPVLNPASGQTIVQPNGTACGEAKAAADAAIVAANAAIESAQGQLDQLQRGGAPATQVSLQTQVTSAAALVKATAARLAAVQGTGVQAQQAQLQSQKDQATGQLAAAQNNLATAQAQLAAAQNGTLDAERKATASQVEAARQKLATDQAHLEQIVAGPQPENVQIAQNAVDQANQALALAQQPSTDSAIAGQQAQVAQAQQQLLKAQSPYSAYDIQQQAHAVAEAQAALDARANPYSDQDLASAQAQVDQTEAALQQAQLTLQQMQITAPVDGMVLARLVSPGAVVGPQTTIVTLTPPAVEVDTTVVDAQLAAIEVGQSASLQISAYPGTTFNGSVTSVAPAVDPKTLTAAVRITPQDPDHQLRAGMQAVVTVYGATPDALVVPRTAVIGPTVTGGTATVVTVDDNQAQPTSVRLGAVGSNTVQVTSGLNEGDVVATVNPAALTSGEQVMAQVQTAEVAGHAD
jgi:RND family efflux transporter MFP subunit